MKKEKVNIGFDIGITSVGWSIVDTKNVIIARGVRLFEELKNPKDGKLENQTRRDKRHLRRTIRRRAQRKIDFKNLILRKYSNTFKVNSLDELEKILDDGNTKILDLKVSALKQEIKPNELLKILYHYLASRGYTYLTLDDYDKKMNNYKQAIDNGLEPLANFILNNPDIDKFKLEEKASEFNLNKIYKTNKQVISAAKSINENKDKINKFPSEILLENYKKNGHYIGLEINSQFSIYEYEKEIEQILKNQPYIKQDFINDYLKKDNSVFSRLRSFAEGPGPSQCGDKSYGIFKWENGSIIKEIPNLWEKTIGKCSVYVSENRAPKYCCSSEISNLLSQLNNLKIIDTKGSKIGNKLTYDQKLDIFNSIFSSSFNKPSLKNIAKALNIQISQLIGYPKTKDKEKEDFDNMSSCKILYDIFKEKLNLKDFQSVKNNLNFLNQIVVILSKNPENIDGQKHDLISFDKNILNQEIINSIINAGIKASQTHSMSLKALNEHIENEVSGGLTLNQKFKSIIEENQLKKFGFHELKSKYMNINCLDEEIISPTTKCSFRETIKVFNKILKKFIYSEKYDLNNIVIEMATCWSTAEERKIDAEIQKKNEKQKNLAKEHYGYEGNDKNIIFKLRLLQQQNGKDIYDGASLDKEKVINDPSYCQIDHIIPFSISYDNSITNRVLTKTFHNQAKGNDIPKDYLAKNNANKFFVMKEEWKKWFLESDDLYKDDRKYNNLSLEELSRYEVGFIGRNLSDTQYASRIVNQAFKGWLNAVSLNEENKLFKDEQEINVLSVNGRISQRFRSEKYLKLGSKDRSDYSHHAVDATICAILGNASNIIGKLVWFANYKINEQTGEVVSLPKSKYLTDYGYKKFDNEIPWNSLSEKVANIDDVRFSYKVNKSSNNFGFWGDTIISIKKDDNEKYLEKKDVSFLISDKYDEISKGIENLKKYWIKDNKNYYPDPKILNDILKIWDIYSKKCLNEASLSKKNPFRIYMEEEWKEENWNSRPSKPKLIIKRDDFIYKISSIHYYSNINRFVPRNKLNLDRKDQNLPFGAYTGSGWKEIRCYKDIKGSYRLIPITQELIDYKINDVNSNKLLLLFKQYKIDEKNINDFIVFYKGSCLVNKDDNKDIIRVCGIQAVLNFLDIKPINCKSGQNQVSINTILGKYKLCYIDPIGSINF